MFSNKGFTIAVIGAGNMGSGIAQKYAVHGYPVVVVDQSGQALKRSRDSIEAMLKEGVGRGIFKESEAHNALERIRFSVDLNDLSHAELVIEAIFEDLGLKRELFLNLERVCSKDALLATNTSSFKVGDLQRGLRYQGRMLGLHYFYHPAKNRLVEVIGTSATDEGALKKATAIQESINKIVITSKDSPGFVVNRFFVPWLNEAMRIVHENVANIGTVEAAAKGFFKIGMGPFELMNVTGLPITLHSCHAMKKELGDFYAPCPLISSQIEMKKPWDLGGPVESSKMDEIGLRLLSVVSAISCQMVYEENICQASDADLGARVGLLWQLGPFELFNENLDKLLPPLVRLAQATPSFYMPALLEKNLISRKPFPSSHVIAKTVGTIGVLRLNKPDTLNALDARLLPDLMESFSAYEGDCDIEGIVIIGHRRAFMAGADISFFTDNLADHLVPNIVAFAKSAQDFFLRIDRCQKPVIAAVSGMALGGGLELALACDAIIAAKNATLAFPETGIGIYPGLGGTQRTPLRVGVALARYLVLTGSSVSGLDALEMGLVDEIAKDDDVLEEAIARARMMAKESGSKKSIKDSALYRDLAEAFAGSLDLPQSPAVSERAKIAFERLKKKAPLAIKIADELIRSARAENLEDGLKKESSYLEMIFRSEDAKMGLRAALAKERVSFIGR